MGHLERKMLQGGAPSPIFSQILKLPVGVLKLPSPVPVPYLDVETGQEAVTGPLAETRSSRWSGMEIRIFWSDSFFNAMVGWCWIGNVSMLAERVPGMQILPLTMKKRDAETDRHHSDRKPRHLAIVGATGAVGIEMIKVLSRRNFPVASLRLLASHRSAGKKLPFRGDDVTVEPLTGESFSGIDIALFSAGGGISKEFAPHAFLAGAVVVDNSSAFRMDPKVPLVVPEINADAAANHSGIIANPNCTTAITLMAVHPLHRAFGLKRIIASSYQAVSGTGAMAIEELRRQVEAIAAGKPVTRDVYPHQIAFNVLPQVDSFLEDGYTREEMKMQNEGRRIMNLPDLTASVTCVRVPVYRAHSVAVTAEFEKPVSLEKAREALAAAPGIRIHDDPANSVYPMPIECSGEDDCRVGRLRIDCALPNALSFWVCGDQLLKGAALNAVQIAELL